MPISWCGVVSKTIGIIVRLVGRNGRLGPGVPNVLWHVRKRAGFWEGGDAMKVGDWEEMAVSTAGQGGNGGGVQSLVCRVAAKPTVMLATGIGCCGPQVVLVCTSKGQAVNMKTQLIFAPSIPSFCFSYTTSFPCSEALSSSPSHERHIQGAAASLSSGGEAACLQGVHDKVQEGPGRGESRIEVVERGGRRSDRHQHNYCVIGDDRGNVSMEISTEQMTQEN